MKTAVISDIHANIEALQAVVDHAREAGVEEFVCLGDVVGYNADPGACIDLLRDIQGLRCILGNHDAMAVGEGPLKGINAQALASMTWTRKQLTVDQKAWLTALPLNVSDPDVTYCHASLDEPTTWLYVNSALDAARHFAYQETRLAFMGHSHMMFSWWENGQAIEKLEDRVIDSSAGDRWLVSVGSVGQPRDHDPRAGYGLYDHDSGRVSLERVEYDVAAAQGKILEAGLPAVLAERLG